MIVAIQDYHSLLFCPSQIVVGGDSMRSSGQLSNEMVWRLLNALPDHVAGVGIIVDRKWKMMGQQMSEGKHLA